MLRHAQIRSKVIAILALPLAGLIALAAIGIGTTLARGVEAGRRNDLAQLAVRGNTLVHELQAERTLSSDWVAARPRPGTVPRDGMLAQRVVVDRTVSAFERFVGGLDRGAYDPRVRQALDRALKEVRGIWAHRVDIDGGASSPAAEAVEATYSRVVSALLELNAAIAVGSDDEALFRSVSAFVALSRLKNTTELERGFPVSELLTTDPEQQRIRRFISFVTERETWLAQLRLNATPEQLARYEAISKGPEASRVATIERSALSGSPADTRAIGTGERLDRSWFAAMTERVNALRRLERELAAGMLATSRAVESSANRQTALWLVGIAALLLVTAALSLVIARSLIGPLRNLQDTAENVAQQLPEAVERIQRLHDPDQGGLPAPGRAQPFDASAKDEISRVARSFNAAHTVAIRVASEQAALRRSIADMFQNIAQRTQVLVRRSLELIDDLEQDEIRPETLERLFQVDHLITRMRRNAENLIVLAGADLPNQWSDPVPLSVLIRSAIAEVEDYRRVDALPIRDLEIVGHGAVDVIHLLAELIENATTFSPPDTRVTVAGAQAANGYVVEIEDKGTGMSGDELARANQLMADPPAVDSALSRRLGLHVVARLAMRHGIQVQLRQSWYNGVTALVLLPERLLIHPAPDTVSADWGAGEPAYQVRSAVPHGGAVAVMPPPLAWTSQPAVPSRLPLRRPGRQPAPDPPRSPSHQLLGPDQQGPWQGEPPNGKHADVPPTASGLPKRLRHATRPAEPGTSPPRSTDQGGAGHPAQPSQPGPPTPGPPTPGPPTPGPPTPGLPTPGPPTPGSLQEQPFIGPTIPDPEP